MATIQAHATAVNTQVMTRAQSLAAVQTLLRAGLSCITFLRNLLPEDNFTESHLTTSDESFPPSLSETDGTPASSKRTKVNGFKIKTLTRGYTDEADRLLNYLENGIFDALEKQYLRSFIFAVYLDSKDPNNIVEAYTFNFKYHNLAGADGPVPVMSLGEDLQNMSLNGRSGSNSVDPVADAIQKGRAPTIGDVKRSLRTMMKTLIQAITHMEELPRRRFATFKLFYTDITPPDYEPPNFQSGDEQKDKWFFMTHSLEEVPDRFSVGKLDCGYHSVNVKVTSIATYLPSQMKDDNVPFTGTVSGAVAKGMRLRPTPNEEALSSARQAEQQQDDAKARNLVWSTEDDIELTDEDAEGEPDTGTDYVQRPDGSYEKVVQVESKSSEKSVPLGIRNPDGEIEELPEVPVTVETQLEAQFTGVAERIPTRLNEINGGDAPKAIPVEETQALIETQPMTMESENQGSFTFNLRPVTRQAEPPRVTPSTSLPPSNLAMELDSPMSSTPPSLISSFAAGGSSNQLDRDSTPVPQDSEMLDLETQPTDMDSQLMDSIKSFSLNPPGPSGTPAGKAPASSSPVQPGSPVKDLGLQCNCKVSIEDEVCFCEGECGKWYHIWCMGFHSTDDSRLPAKFICYDCRLRADMASWYLIKDTVYPQIMAKWTQFVTFRRAIKVAENTQVITQVVFAKAFDNDTSLARQLMKQLEEEEYIHALTTTTNEFGLTTEVRETRAKSAKGKDKKMKSRKTALKARFAFNKQIKSQQKYKDHFTPTPEVESRMLGLDNFSKFKEENDSCFSRPRGTSAQPVLVLPINPVNIEILPVETQTQTQDETQLLRVKHELNQKRAAAPSHMDRMSKKMKISLALGIDLAE